MSTRIDCPNCCSANRLKLEPIDFAYECWSCGQRMWIDENAAEEYQLLNSLSRDDADKELQEGIPRFAIGVSLGEII